jgi:very-short-patch-repair endonuclease
MDKHHHFNPHLKDYARKHRNDSTRAEIHLWAEVLRASGTGFPFRRQRPIGKYIADFVCLPKKLIIEIDGITHTYEGAVERDLIRQNELEKLGFAVIRFTDEEVLTSTENVREAIIAKLNSIPLAPSKRGTSDGPEHNDNK